MILKYRQMSPFNQSGYNISNYFLAFCLLEEFYILLRGDKIIFKFFVKLLIIVISM